MNIETGRDLQLGPVSVNGVQDWGTIAIHAGAGQGGSVAVIADGSLSVESKVWDISPEGDNGQGGAIFLQTGDEYMPTSPSGAINVTGALNADGKGTGSGGYVEINAYGTEADLAIGAGGNAARIYARSGKDGGDGGVVIARAGRHLTVDMSAVHLSPRGVDGNGGTVEFDSGKSGGGDLLVNGTINVNGKGVGNGGNITLDPIIVPPPGGGPPVPGQMTVHGDLRADAGTTGTGGMIIVSAQGSKSSVAIGDGDNVILARGGSESGDGGNVIVQADGDISLYVNLISASGRGGDGKGGNIDLHAGASGQGFLILAGDVRADSLGASDGGDISITMAGDSLVLGGTGQRQTISADAHGTGKGGAISVTNAGNSDLRFAYVGRISATSAAGELGDLSFTCQNGAVSIAGDGPLDGWLSVAAKTDIMVDPPPRLFLKQSITSESGHAIRYEASKLIRVSESVVWRATDGDIELVVPLLELNGKIVSDKKNGLFQISSTSDLTIIGSGSLQAIGENTNISLKAVSGQVTVRGQGGQVRLETMPGTGVAGDIVISAGKSINMTDVVVTSRGGNPGTASQISASGNVNVRSAGSIRLADVTVDTSSRAVNGGMAGSIALEASNQSGAVTLTNVQLLADAGGRISVSGSAIESTGYLNISSSGRTGENESGGAILMIATSTGEGTGRIRIGGTVRAAGRGFGQGGAIELEAADIMSNGVPLSLVADGGVGDMSVGGGQAGYVLLHARSTGRSGVFDDGNIRLAGSTISCVGAEPGQGIHVLAERNIMLSAVRVDGSSSGAGQGSEIVIQAGIANIESGSIALDGQIESNSTTGGGGHVLVEGFSISGRGLSIKANCTDSGDAGKIELLSSKGSLRCLQANFQAEAENGRGGTIALRAPSGNVLLDGQVSVNHKGDADSGSITVTGQAVNDDGDRLVLMADAEDGKAGQVTISGSKVSLGRACEVHADARP